MSLFRVLHLSDIHIGNTYKSSEDLAYKVISDIEHNGLCSVNAVAITGDIFDGPSAMSDSLVDEAVTFFNILLSEINAYQSQHQIDKEDFIFVPGNHDLLRVDHVKQRWDKYRSFLTKFYGSIPDWYNKENFSVCRVYEIQQVAFIGFNSCQLEKKKIFSQSYIDSLKRNIDSDVLSKQGINKNLLIDILEDQVADEYQDFGLIPMVQITEVERKIKDYNDFTIIALFHHHFYLFPEISKEFGDTSLIRNHTEITQHLKYMNVKTVLHGHKHYDLERPFISEDYYDTTESIVDVFAAGSLGASGKERHTFNILDFYDKTDGIKLIQKKFVYNDELLEGIVVKQIPPKNLANKVVKLCEIIASINPSAHKAYIEFSEKLFKIHSDCDKITAWVSEALTGFSEVYKYLTSSDCRNILFILYAINYRTLSYLNLVEKDEFYFNTTSPILNAFYVSHIKNSDFLVQDDEYHKLFSIKDLKRLSTFCDNLLNSSSNKSTQEYLAFTMVGIFFTDLYLILTKYADDFKESIKYKVNIKIEENKFHENVPAPRIIIKSDADRRSASIQLRCNEATAHKMAVLFIKEFDLLINKFEDYFKLIGLKLYYIFPQIDKDNLKDSLDNYNFEAYIPTLLPLLTGDNIYPSKVVFARELIQNSIDAIAVREAKDKTEFSNTIMLDIGLDEKKRRYFKITDHGTGMDRYKIERYFTSIGRSFYSGDEFEDLQISYKPISNFGIGFLSSFMVCKEIDVKTKYYDANCEGLKLHIPNYDGCFFIEKEDAAEVGTELELYLNCDLEDKDIVDYIQKVMLDIKYNILIKVSGRQKNQEIHIPAHQIRTRNLNNKLVFFIPLTEDNKVLDIKYNTEVLSGNFIHDYEYGILICGDSTPNSTSNHILNAGILVEQASTETLFDFDRRVNYRHRYMHNRDFSYNSIYMNFPANWIQLDVSREKLSGFSDYIANLEKNKQLDTVGVKIAAVLYNQIIGFLENSKVNTIDIPIAYLQEVIDDGICFCNRSTSSEIHKKLISLRYRLQITFSQTEIIFEILHRGNGSRKDFNIIKYSDDFAATQRMHFAKTLHFARELRHISLDMLQQHSGFSHELYRYIEDFIHMSKKGIAINKKMNAHFKDFFGDIPIDFQSGNTNVFYLLALLLLNIPDEEMKDDMERMSSVIFIIEGILMQTLKISEVASGNNSIRISYDKLAELFGEPTA